MTSPAAQQFADRLACIAIDTHGSDRRTVSGRTQPRRPQLIAQALLDAGVREFVEGHQDIKVRTERPVANWESEDGVRRAINRISTKALASAITPL